MSHRPGKPKSGNVVLLAGYTHGAIGYDSSGAERNESWLRDEICGHFPEQYRARHGDPIRYRVNKWAHNIDRLSKTSFLEDFTPQLAVWKWSRARPGIALHMK